MSTHVEVTARPVTLLEHLFAGSDGEHVITNMLGGRFGVSGFVHFTSLLVNKSVNAVTLTVDAHVDLVILATSGVHFESVTIRSSLLESITQHQAILDDVEVNGVASSTLGTELGELLSGGVRKRDHRGRLLMNLL